MEIASPLLTSNFERTALYDELELRCGLRPDAGWERIAPIVPSAEDCERIGLGAGEAAFFLERFSTVAGRPIEWRTTTIRGDRYRFVAHYEVGTAPPLVAAARA